MRACVCVRYEGAGKGAATRLAQEVGGDGKAIMSIPVFPTGAVSPVRAKHMKCSRDENTRTRGKNDKGR